MKKNQTEKVTSLNTLWNIKIKLSWDEHANSAEIEMKNQIFIKLQSGYIKERYFMH